MNPLQHNPEPAKSSNRDGSQFLAYSADAERGIAPGKPGRADAELRRAEKFTRKLARSHYENFWVASVLLPRRFRQPFYNVYAYCRTADDLADESPSPQEALLRLDDFQQRLDATFAGSPSDPLFLALSDTVQRFSLPKQPFDDLLDAFRQDQRKTRYDDFEQLQGYCRRSANPVGRIVLTLADADGPANVEFSDAICTGLQLANFWQDVARDWKIGRVYLPQDSMREHGVQESMLSCSHTPDALRELLAAQCDVAEQFLRAGEPLANRVPRWLSADIRLFIHGGLETLGAIRGIDYDVLAVRPKVSKMRQTGLLLRAMVGRL